MSFLLHPFANPHAQETDFTSIERAQGSTVWDRDGKEYLDGLASLWYCQIGHGNAEMIGSITSQLETLDTFNIFAPLTMGISHEAASEVCRVSPFPDGKVYFGCSGSEAIDTALKIARLLPQLAGDKDRQVIVRRTRGYHGTTMFGTSAQGIAPNRENWGDLVPHFVEIPGDDIEAAARVFAEHGPRIAALITEPVQGAGGVFPPEEGYLEGLRRLCSDNGALLIFDEVINGFGRTGKMFASQTYNVTPDLITFAKGVTSGYQPVSGVLISRGVVDRLDTPIFRHGYTYSGHPAGAAAVIANIRIIERDGLAERATHLGTRFEAGLSALAADGVIDSYRGIGAIWAAELGEGVDAIPVREKMRDHGVIVRGIGSAIAFCPPLIMTDDEVARMIDVLAECHPA